MAKQQSRNRLDEGALMLVGLGNPGPKYDLTRHNIGFMLIDHLASRWGLPLSREKFKAQMGSGHSVGRRVILLKPQTYMNLSGQSVSRAAEFFSVGVGAMIVVHDDIDLPFGAVRLKCGGGAGGHNGLKSIDSLMGKRDYFRLRMGVGRPQHGDVSHYVLQRFDAMEQAEMGDFLDRGQAAIETLVSDGLKEAQNKHHGAKGRQGKA